MSLKDEMIPFSECEPLPGQRIFCILREEANGEWMTRTVFLEWNPDYKNKYEMEFLEWKYV